MTPQTAVVERATKSEPETLTAIFETSCTRNSSRPALRWKKAGEWREINYRELEQRVHDFVNGLLSFGLEEGDAVAIFGRNSPEWAIADWAAVTTGLVTIPIYDTLTAEKAAYILKDSAARVCIVQTRDHLVKIRSVRKQLPKLRRLIVIEEIFEKELESGEHLFDELYKLGRAHAAKNPRDREKLSGAVKPGDLASIVYTSGTTGEPKGALLTHNNFASNVVAALQVIPIQAGDVYLSFLPLSHVFERMAGHFTAVHAGATVSYAESIEKVPENMLEVRPTVILSVPRLYEKLYARVQEKVRGDSFLKRYIFHKAIEAGKKYVHEKYTLKVENPSTTKKYKRFDRLVFTKLRDRVGGRLKFFVSGGAPLSPQIHEFFTAAGLPILQGYGLTETSPVVAANTFDGFRIGSVGRPFPGADIRIAEDGEILVKGPMVFNGYHNKPEATKEVFTKDGYFKTGDIGRLDEDGFLFITDRKKELIVMSNGKKVAPQPVENDLKTKPGIGQAVLLGNNQKYIAALLAPDVEGLRKWAEGKGIKVADLAELVTQPAVQELFRENVEAVNKSLSRYEQIKRFKVLGQEFAQDSGELTPTLKIKRRVIEDKFKAQIAELFSGDGAAE